MVMLKIFLNKCSVPIEGDSSIRASKALPRNEISNVSFQALWDFNAIRITNYLQKSLSN